MRDRWYRGYASWKFGLILGGFCCGCCNLWVRICLASITIYICVLLFNYFRFYK
jgi:hypothetical protein